MQIQDDEPGSEPEIYSDESDLTVDNELLYHGRRYDSESNLYYYRARYYDPILGRFLSTDPMGYKDSMNLYQAFNMNGYNFVDPMGLWKKRNNNWSSGNAFVKRESKTDSLEELSTLITGSPVYSSVVKEINGTVDVTLLVMIFKSQVQKNIAIVGRNAPNNFEKVEYGLKQTPIGFFHENDINSLFTPLAEGELPVLIDCTKAATLIRHKGLIDTLNPGEYDAAGLNPWVDNEYLPGQNLDIPHTLNSLDQDVEIGDQVHFMNKTDYVDRFGHAGYEGEWTVKIDDDHYYGFPGFIHSYQGWKNLLLQEYNSMCTENRARISDVVGYYGHIWRLPYFSIAEKLFDLRNKKK